MRTTTIRSTHASTESGEFEIPVLKDEGHESGLRWPFSYEDLLAFVKERGST